MGVRRQAREAAVQATFSADALNHWNTENVDLVFDSFEINGIVREYAKVIMAGLIEHRDALDAQITRASENWSLTRMSRVDKAILRVAVYELTHRQEVPVNVAINEAIEIAKRFGATESGPFINGVLDRIARARRDAQSRKHSERGAIKDVPSNESDFDDDNDGFPTAVGE